MGTRKCGTFVPLALSLMAAKRKEKQMSKIMVIEDDEAIQKMLCLNLSVAGYQTIVFEDGQQVLDYLNQGGLADLALVDVMLPKVDGFALLNPLKGRNIPCHFLDSARGA